MDPEGLTLPAFPPAKSERVTLLLDKRWNQLREGSRDSPAPATWGSQRCLLAGKRPLRKDLNSSLGKKASKIGASRNAGRIPVLLQRTVPAGTEDLEVTTTARSRLMSNSHTAARQGGRGPGGTDPGVTPLRVHTGHMHKPPCAHTPPGVHTPSAHTPCVHIPM